MSANLSFISVMIFAFLLQVSVGDAVLGEIIVVPNRLATSDGNFFHDGGAVPVRVMQIHDASQFSALPAPFYITQIAFRPDAAPGPTGPRDLTLQLFASTSSQSVAGLSNVFAQNIGTDNTLVFSGTQTWTTANLPGSGNAKQFDILRPLTTPFLYDPRAGNLVLDFQISGGGGSLIRRDAASGDPTVNFVASPGSATATAGNVLGFGFVTEFTVEPIPEPATVALLGLGMAGFFVVSRHRSRMVANVPRTAMSQ